ncbi:alkaline phosphatase [Dysgonomonas sp. ZJ279]|uniref:alkaline phosphatase n=1 Tax=Dysgonomonas sp. ZJ279 TaxID=2709796 RepID=UPI0013ED7910|nr:alkaline phosphatase [Dysgonomonas sp. ZJ279]
MNKTILRRILFLGLSIICSGIVFAQKPILIHSHNDYEQRVPFYQAYAQQVASIEADIYTTNKPNELLVAHDRDQLTTAPTLEESYILPLVNLYKQNNGKAWKNSDNILTLLVDLKTPANPTLDILIKKLQVYPEVFDPTVNPYAVRVVISGNRPDPNDYGKYPAVVSFDGSKTDYTPEQLKRISMISLNLRDHTQWNGKGTMINDEFKKVMQAIKEAHTLGKPIRFWGTPDGVTAWNTFHNIGVDYINTDRPEACADYFRNFENKNYHIAGSNSEVSDEVSRAKRLDKTTVGFQGFNNKKLQLSKGIDVYQPTYLNDGAIKPIKNIIFLIGDGMGLAQLCAGETVNHGLTMLNMNYIGLQKTSSKDAYTTDSAAAGSALATGESNSNRHISMSDDGKPYSSMTDVLYPEGFACGVVTLGNLADATPAAFYGHSVERDNSDEITNWLLDGKLTLLNGSGMDVFTKRKDNRDLLGELKSQYRISTSIDDINKDKSKVICVDERMDLAASEETLSLLADATREAIQKLSGASDKGFFLMVEGAKIDYAGHANSLPGSIMETLSFDLAVAEAMKFADKNGETLIIVTGDHETGGLTLVDGDRAKGHITARYMTDDHTPIMLPVFAYGPGASKLTGVYPNTQIFHRIKSLMGLK